MKNVGCRDLHKGRDPMELFSMKRNELLEKHISNLVEICKQIQVARLEVFGSACDNRFNPNHSDLDFLVEFKTLPPAVHADCYFGLLDALQDLFHKSIDLIEIKAINNPFFEESIQNSRSLLYAA